MNRQPGRQPSYNEMLPKGVKARPFREFPPAEQRAAGRPLQAQAPSGKRAPEARSSVEEEWLRGQDGPVRSTRAKGTEAVKGPQLPANAHVWSGWRPQPSGGGIWWDRRSGPRWNVVSQNPPKQ